MMLAAEAIGRQVAEMQDALAAADMPSKGQPLAGVISSSMVRCRQIAAQMVVMSSEMATQLQMFENGVTRGRRLARMQQLARAAGKASTKHTMPKPEPEPGLEEDDRWDEWDDDL